jgi:protein-S-isoprenylcysteine O-methyltransferase Ste14
VRATKFEFERRFWIICAVYLVAFGLLFFDPLLFTTFLRHVVAPSLQRNSPEAREFFRIVVGLGAALVFISAALRTWAAAYLQTDIVHDTAQHSEALVADGPFRYTRNPLYLANIPLAAGIGVLASRSGWFFLIAANWIFVYRLIAREEESLRQSQGEKFLAYCRAVPRFWPSLKPRIPSGNLSPRWGQAFAGEGFVWTFGIAELSIAVTLNNRLSAIIFPLAFVVYFLGVRFVRSKSRSPA